MPVDAVRNTVAVVARRSVFALVSALALIPGTVSAQTTVTLPPITVGAGVRTDYVNTSPDKGDSLNDFQLDSIRLYVNGSVTDKIKIQFDTEYDSNNHVNVLDAIAKFEFSDKANIWMGRMLPPSDRANLAGPYYQNHWSAFTDGVQDGYPFVATGRDNGFAYWGQFNILKVSAGLFDGPSATPKTNVIAAYRAQVDFWDPEPGYYVNGTYYGDKNILAIGAAGQNQDGNNAFDVDFLMERKLPSAGTVTVEGEYADYDKLGGYNARYGSDKGGYVLGSYLFPNQVGWGRFQVLGKFAKANFSKGLTVLDPNYDQKTTELNLNYIIKEFNARVMVFFKNTNYSAVQTSFKQAGVGIQLQM